MFFHDELPNISSITVVKFIKYASMVHKKEATNEIREMLIHGPNWLEMVGTLSRRGIAARCFLVLC